MQITVESKDLKKSFTHLNKVVSYNNTLPILRHLCFRAKDDILTIEGTNLEQYLSLCINANIETEGECLVPFRELKKLISKTAQDKVTFTFPVNESKLGVSAGDLNINLNTLPIEDYPMFPKFNDPKTIMSFDLEWLNEWQDTFNFAVSSNDTRPGLQSVYIESKDDETNFVATNGHRLSKLSFPFSEFDSMIVPKMVFELLKRVGGKRATIQWQEEKEESQYTGHVSFSDENYEIISRLIEGPYPDYEQVIPKDLDKTVIFNREKLLKALGQILPFANPATHRVEVYFDDSLQLRANTRDIGNAEVEIPVSYNGERTRLDFNGSYIEEFLKKVPFDELKWSFSLPTRATIFEPIDGTDYLHLLMPLKTEEYC